MHLAQAHAIVASLARSVRGKIKEVELDFRRIALLQHAELHKDAQQGDRASSILQVAFYYAYAGVPICLAGLAVRIIDRTRHWFRYELKHTY